MSSTPWTRARALPLALLDLAVSVAAQPNCHSVPRVQARQFLYPPKCQHSRHVHAFATKRADTHYSYADPGPSVSESFAGTRSSENESGETSTGSRVRYPSPALREDHKASNWSRKEKEKIMLDTPPPSPMAARIRASVNALAALPTNEPEPMNPPTYTDAELQEIYADVLAHPSDPQTQSQIATQGSDKDNKITNRRYAHEQNMKTLEVVSARLFTSSAESDNTNVKATSASSSQTSSLTARLTARARDKGRLVSVDGTSRSSKDVETKNVEGTEYERGSVKTVKLQQQILSRIEDVVHGIEMAQKVSVGSTVTTDLLPAPVAVLSVPEWTALVEVFIKEREITSALHALDLMKRSGVELPDKLANTLLNYHASRGDVPAFETSLSRLVNDKPTEFQRDLHIKAHLKSHSPIYGTTTALSTLHKYESLALAPPVQSYTRIITTLFSTQSTKAHAHAWDLFAHMRYVAHLYPDALLYALMIRACAGLGSSHSSFQSEPERAVDLFTEMRYQAKLEPTVGAYNAVILACARKKGWAGEAFRFAREMVDASRDARGVARWRPDAKTFKALLVAAKVSGDLNRARWILAEMLKSQTDDRMGERAAAPAEIDEEALMHVFHAYATYKPPFRRADTKIVDGEAANTSTKKTDDKSSPEGATSQSHDQSRDQNRNQMRAVAKPPLANGRFGVVPPQTRKEVLAEVDILFSRMLEDGGRVSSSPESRSPLTHNFTLSRPTSRLVNAYLSVYYAHSTLPTSRAMFRSVFDRAGVKPTARSYVEALDRCGKAKKSEGDDKYFGKYKRREEGKSNPTPREDAYAFACELWEEWKDMETSLKKMGSEARLIERAYALMIRVLVISDHLNDALSLVREFTHKYPPSALLPLPSSPSSSDPKNELQVHLTTPSSTPDDTIPPFLTFRDLQVLHERLTRGAGVHPMRKAQLGFLTYISKAYEGALVKRRAAALGIGSGGSNSREKENGRKKYYDRT